MAPKATGLIAPPLTLATVSIGAAFAAVIYSSYYLLYRRGAAEAPPVSGAGAAAPAAAPPAPAPDAVTITDIVIYPVKGLRGLSVPCAETDGCGFLNDRRWLLAWAPLVGPAQFRTQRDAPAMATLGAHVLPAGVLAAVREWVAAASASGRAQLGASEVLEVAHAAAAARGAGGGACAGGGVCPATAAAGAPAALLLTVDREFNAAGGDVGDWALVPLTRAGDAGAVLRDVAVWSSLVPEAVDQGDAAAAFLAAVLPGVAAEAAAAATGGALPPGTPGLRLLYQDPGWERGARAINSSWMPLPAFLNPAAAAARRWPPLRRLLRAAWWAASGGGLSCATSFADGFPVLLAAEESLAALNAAAAARAGAPPLPMARFRPNLVVRGGGAWAEDTWEEVRAEGSGLRLRGVKRCSRCSVTTTDQRSGAREADAERARAEPLATLDATRASRNGPTGTLAADGAFRAGGVFFGMNMLIAGDFEGRALRVGERLQLLRVADAPVGPL